MEEIKDYFENIFGPDVCNFIFDIKKQIEFCESNYKQTKFNLDYNIKYFGKTPYFYDIINKKELTYDEYIHKVIAMKYSFTIQRDIISYTISDDGIFITPKYSSLRTKILSITYS